MHAPSREIEGHTYTQTANIIGMPATVHFVRHAQGIHNLSREHEKI